MGKALCSLVGGVWSWHASLPSFASINLVRAKPLSAKQPLEDSCLHRPALALLGGVASRQLSQLALWTEPVFLLYRHGDSWDASRQIARFLAYPRSHPHDRNILRIGRNDHRNSYFSWTKDEDQKRVGGGPECRITIGWRAPPPSYAPWW
jgi:hypothetical protein